MSNCSLCGSEWAYLSLSSVECVNPSCSAYDHEHARRSFADYFRKRTLLFIHNKDLGPVNLPKGWEHAFKESSVVCWAPRPNGDNEIFRVNF